MATAESTRDIPGVVDIPNVEHVIHFNLPRDVQEYVHRMGPQYGQPQLATSLVESNQGLPEWLLSDEQGYEGGFTELNCWVQVRENIGRHT